MIRRQVTGPQGSGRTRARILLLPELALAQTSPFLTGATALQTNILAWLTPIAIILVMVLGGMAEWRNGDGQSNRLNGLCAGVHVMALGWEPHIPAILRAAGLRPKVLLSDGA